MKLAAAGTALAIGANVARSGQDEGSAGSAAAAHRVQFHNWTGREASLDVVGHRKTLAVRVTRAWEAFDRAGPIDLPAGEYVYVVRAAGGEVIAYGKLRIAQSGPIWILAGTDTYSFKRLGC
jgi:hypothetical protein